MQLAKFVKLTQMLTLLALAGCSPDPAPIIQREVVTVEVPVLVKTPLPPELVNGFEVELPEFVAPEDPAATSALTAEGEQRMKTLLLILNNLREAVRQWNEAS